MKKKKRSKRKHSSNNKFLIIALLVIVAVIAAGKILSQKQPSQTGNVLGSLLTKGGDDSSGSSGSGSSGSDSSGSESSGSSGDNDDSSQSSGSSGSNDSRESGSSGSSGSSVTNGATGGTGGSSSNFGIFNFFKKSAPTPSQVEDEDDEDEDTEDEDDEDENELETEIEEDEQRTEIRLSEEERIRTRTKDGRTRIDITAGGIKTRFEIRDDRVVIKAEQEDGTEVELEDDTIFKIEERLATNQIKIATDEANRFVIQRGATGAVSQFPISIDLATNTLIVDTPSGQRNLVVLPDQVIQNLIVTNVVNRLGGGAVVSSFRTGETSTLAQLISLGERNGIPIYEINGISDQRLLGLIPVTIEKSVEVSAETGAVVSTQVSFADRIVDLLSF